MKSYIYLGFKLPLSHLQPKGMAPTGGMRTDYYRRLGGGWLSIQKLLKHWLPMLERYKRSVARLRAQQKPRNGLSRGER